MLSVALGSQSDVPFVGDISVHKCDQLGAPLQADDVEVTIPPGAIPPRVTTDAYKNVPFVEDVKIYECDSQGASFKVDDIEVIIPPMAIPQGVTAHVEMGVALYGPFSFADGCQPVSPILWFCTQEHFEFKQPMTFKLPHTVMDDGGIRLAFAKANHLEERSAKMFSFKEIDSDKPIEYGLDSDLPRYGILSSRHHCFLCIQAEAKISSLKDMSLQKGYCLHILIKQEDSFTYQILLVCTFFLETCFSVSQGQRYVGYG